MSPDGEEKVSSDVVGNMRRFLLCGIYIVISSGLIDFNKFLINKNRFPFAMVLTWMHMFMSWILCMCLYAVAPGLYPTLEKTAGRRGELIKWFVPLGLLFAIGLYASNQAYLYCSVAFLQFMKEANLVIVFFMSALAGLQTVNRAKIFVIMWIIAASTLAVKGEIRFVMAGFVLQLMSMFTECGKNVLGEYLLTSSGLKLDPLTYTMFMAPVCLCVLTVGVLWTWDNAIIAGVQKWWPYLLPNSCLAFCLNVTVSIVIKECSATGFVLSGLLKDIVVVCMSSMMFGDVITPQQNVGFLLCIMGVFFWSYMKIAPQSKLIQSYHYVLCMEPDVSTKALQGGQEERAPLLPGKKGKQHS